MLRDLRPKLTQLQGLVIGEVRDLVSAADLVQARLSVSNMVVILAAGGQAAVKTKVRRSLASWICGEYLQKRRIF